MRSFNFGIRGSIQNIFLLVIAFLFNFLGQLIFHLTLFKFQSLKQVSFFPFKLLESKSAFIFTFLKLPDSLVSFLDIVKLYFIVESCKFYIIDFFNQSSQSLWLILSILLILKMRIFAKIAFS